MTYGDPAAGYNTDVVRSCRSYNRFLRNLNTGIVESARVYEYFTTGLPWSSVPRLWGSPQYDGPLAVPGVESSDPASVPAWSNGSVPGGQANCARACFACPLVIPPVKFKATGLVSLPHTDAAFDPVFDLWRASYTDPVLGVRQYALTCSTGAWREVIAPPAVPPPLLPFGPPLPTFRCHPLSIASRFPVLGNWVPASH